MSIIGKDESANLANDIKKFGAEKAYLANLPVSLEVAHQIEQYNNKVEASIRLSSQKLAKKAFAGELDEEVALAKERMVKITNECLGIDSRKELPKLMSRMTADFSEMFK